MEETLKTSFNDKKGVVEVQLRKSYITEGNYGMITRKKVDISNIIADVVDKHQSALNDITLYHAAAVLKKGILNALRQGESVNLFDIGLLYPTIRGTVHKDMSLTELAEHIHLSFTPSETAEKEVQSVIVKNVRFADAGRTIYTVINLYDEQAPDNTLTRGMTAQITGKAIKLGGDKNGLYFAPLDNKLVPVQDRSLWIKTEHLCRNLPKTVEFYVPENLEPNTDYRIVIETSLATNGVPMKSTAQVISDIVQVQ